MFDNKNSLLPFSITIQHSVKTIADLKEKESKVEYQLFTISYTNGNQNWQEVEKNHFFFCKLVTPPYLIIN